MTINNAVSGAGRARLEHSLNDAIPAELRALPQWVCWRYETRNDKQTKPPIQPKSNGKLLHARSNDPSTWSDFDTAVAAAVRLNLEGVGLNLWESDGLTGLDLDHIFDPATGELDPLAREVLERFAGTYAEISPSGTGLRVWCYGKPGRSGKVGGKVKWLEVYSHPSNRYLTVTGNQWPGSADAVTEQQAALDWLHGRFMDTSKDASTGQGDRAAKTRSNAPPSVEVSLDLDDAALLDKARSAKNGSSFDALWSGDTSRQGGDHSSADMALLNALAFWTNKDSDRMDRLFRQSGLMRPKWDVVHDPEGQRTYGQISIDKAIADCRETYSGKRPDGGQQQTRKEKSARPAAESVAPRTGLNPYRGTDDANADLFLKRHGQDVRFCPPWNKWLLWTGTHWQIDERLDVKAKAETVALDLYREAAATDDSDRRRKIAGLAFTLETVGGRTSMLTAVQHKVVIHHSDLDKGHFLLNASNGTVDLTTGRCRPHERRDLLTHDIEIHFDPAAVAPTWLQFLISTFAGDAELIAFVQRAVGYSLTGDVREQVLLICHGVGSNGKSVFLNVLRKLLGKLAMQAAPDLLMVTKERHPTDQADLFSKRLVVCQETGEGRRFNETLVKQVTGGDGIRARRMREDFWEFNPTHKLWLSTNHKPEIRGTDHAIWRRIRLIPFNVKFTDDGPARKDPLMEQKLTAELPGILAWAIKGCLDWQRQGLQAPSAVTEATADYQAEMDVLAAWMNECCIVKKHCETKAADLYASYTGWCEQSGEHPEKQRKFGMRLTERGFDRFNGTAGYSFWKGIGLRTRVDEVDEVDEVSSYSPRTSTQPFYRESSSTRSTSSTINFVPPVEPAFEGRDVEEF